ncbi:MAG: lactate racemase domain-containing protein [Candidatus Helarchaeota archaeon]
MTKANQNKHGIKEDSDNIIVNVGYGKGNLELTIPKNNFKDFFTPKQPENTRDDIENVLKEALENPKGKMLNNLVKDKIVCVLLEDGTRASSQKIIVNVIMPYLISAKELRIFITTGSHDPDTSENQEIFRAIEDSIKKNQINNYEIIIHDCFIHEFTNIGKTSFGTDVFINKKAANCDVYFTISDLKTHYFAGYSNPVKNFLPGICAYKTIEQNHSLALKEDSTFLRHPLHPDSSRQTQPVSEDMVEAMNLITKGAETYTLNMITLKNKILWAAAGEFSIVTSEGFEKVDEIGAFTVNEKSDYIVVSAGGYPFDGSLYDSQRALELTKNAVKDGGEILFLAECGMGDGIAPNEKAKEFFYNALSKPIDVVLKDIEKDYVLYSHKAFKFAKMLKNTKIWIKSGLDNSIVEKIHLQPINDPQFLINKWVKENPNCKISVFDKGSKLAIFYNKN